MTQEQDALRRDWAWLQEPLRKPERLGTGGSRQGCGPQEHRQSWAGRDGSGTGP